MTANAKLTLQPVTILLCDDEPLECIALQRIFAQAPYPNQIVGVASNGDEAVGLAKEKKPQIVFMDIRMPGMDGLEAIRQIRTFNPHTYVVILTAYSDFTYAQEALRLGALDYVLKPAEPAILYGVLQRLIERIQEEEQTRIRHEQLERKLAEVMPTLPILDVKQDDFVTKAIAHIRAEYHEPLRLVDVAQNMYISPSYLSRRFREYTGVSFKKYLTWVRMEAAKMLLKETQLSIVEIAERVGYTDSNYFSVCFKRLTGLSPSLYRTQERRTCIGKVDLDNGKQMTAKVTGLKSEGGKT